jgi:hypothetical protein
MRRAIVPVASIVLLACLTAPSYGWLFHHGRGHVHHGRYGYGPAVASPFAFGVTLPGGYGFNIDTGNHRQNQNETPPPPARLEIAKDVRDKVDALQAEVHANVGPLTALTEKIAADPKNKAFLPNDGFLKLEQIKAPGTSGPAKVGSVSGPPAGGK